MALEGSRFDAPLAQGEDFNVKADLSGDIYMIDATGGYAGEAYEAENGGTVHWESSPFGDTEPPTAKITSHVYGEVVTWPTITLRGTANDISPIARVQPAKRPAAGDYPMLLSTLHLSHAQCVWVQL